MKEYKKRSRLRSWMAGLLVLAMVISPVLSSLPILQASAASEQVWYHVKTGDGNGNGHTYSQASTSPAAVLLHRDAQVRNGDELSLTYQKMGATNEARFGVFYCYSDDSNWLYIGCNPNGSWYYEYKVDGATNYASLSTLESQSDDSVVDFSMTVQDSAIQARVNDTTAEITLDIVGTLMDKVEAGKFGFRAGALNGAHTEFHFTDVKINDTEVSGDWAFLADCQGQVFEAEAPVVTYRVSGKVQDTEGSGISGATVQIGDASAVTDEAGNYAVDDVLAGDYVLAVSKSGYQRVTTSIKVTEDLSLEPITLEEAGQVTYDTYIESEEMKVAVSESFPQVMQYEMKGDLQGKVFYGQTEELNIIQINGTDIAVTEDNVETDIAGDKATYIMSLKNEGAHVDCVLTAELKVVTNTLEFHITDVKNNLTEKDSKGQEVYPVQRINIPNHSLISVRSSQENANLKGAKSSGYTLISGDKSVDVTDNMTFKSEDFMYGFVSNSELSAGLWSNSEYEGTNVKVVVSAGGASNTRVMATVTDLGGEKSLGLASTEWWYDRKITPSVNGKQETYVVEHGEMPSAKVAIAGDLNEDEQIDWQDGAIAFREIMNNPYKCEEVPELVNQRIAMNFGSQAANPFLNTLDGVKRVYLSTDGLGQSVLLKGYGSEGHDSGHPDYGDIGKRIGGAEDMNTLMTEGKAYNAVFGIHINASEMYTEAKAFNDELSRGNYGWNWLDQGIGINGLYDLGSGSRQARLAELKELVGDNMDFIYLDVWGNNTSGAEDAWESRNIARQVNANGWRFATEWGVTEEYDSTLQHWAADLSYGGAGSKGQNSEVMRFLRNHQKDSWVADYATYNGAAQAPLLGGLTMTDFEGWQGRTSYNKYITIMFRHNLITKFLQHYKVMKWVDGEPVTMTNSEGTSSWTPEMEITLQNDEKDQTVVVTRDSNDYANDFNGFRSRTIKLNGTVISQGARTSGDGTESNVTVGDESYLIPWYWGADGSDLASDEMKLYHWNTQGGTTTWTLPDGWSGLSNVVAYKLTDEGKTEETKIDVIDGQITLRDIEAETAYVVYKGEKSQLDVDWQSSKYIYDTGFNNSRLEDYWTIAGTGTAQIVDNVSDNNMLKLEGEISVTSKALTNLKAGQSYALYIGVDNRSDAKAHMTVKAGNQVLATNYTGKSLVQNMVSSDQHNMKNGATVGNSSYFQNMYVFFTAPESADVTLTLSREAGDEATYFDDVRVVETEMDVIRETDGNGYITKMYQDFEHNAQGIYPFVISGPGQGYAGWVTDNRIHLSEAHGKYTMAGYKDKRVDDVLDGNWSVKINGLTQNNSMIYQTIPQNFHFEPEETYYVSFDYQLGSEGTYQIRVGDESSNALSSYEMLEAAGETRQHGFTFTASDSGQGWFGIFSTDTAPDMQEFAESGDGPKNFSGYKDFILDNLKIEKARMTISDTYIETRAVEEAYPLKVDFVNDGDRGTKVTWRSSDESVAYVEDDGTVRFVGYGSAAITATATFDGEEQTLSCVVKLIREEQTQGDYVNAWANTQETSGEDGRATNVTDYNPSTIWHSKWSGTAFAVSEDNPAIITVQLADDITKYEDIVFRQRSGNNGLVQKYIYVIGNEFDPETNTVSGGFTSEVITAENSGSGQVEPLVIPEETTGTFIQIRVLQGSNGFASIADIEATKLISYETEENEKALAANRVRKLVAQAESLDSRDYSKETWEALSTALNNAKTLLDKADASSAEMKDIESALGEATGNLVTVPGDDSALQKVYDTCISLKEGDYTVESWRELEEALAKVRAVLDNSEATQSMIDQAKAVLEKAQANLKKVETPPVVDKSSLKALYDACSVLRESDYTAETWKTLKTALANAKVILENSAATQNAVNQAAAALKAAKDGLKKPVTTAPEKTLPKAGTIKTIQKLKYKVTKSTASTKTVAVIGVRKKTYQKLTIPATVKIDNVTFKVTSIEKKAFYKNRKLRSVVIGQNVTAIKKNSFFGCRSLKNVTIKSKKIKTIGKNAFKGISGKAKINVPKKRYTAYKKLLKKAKLSSKIKIVKK